MPLPGLAAIGAVASGIGGLASGIGGGKMSKAQIKAQKDIAAGQKQTADEQTAVSREQSRRQLQMSEGQQADALNRQMQTNPMRDQVLHALMARTGMSPQAFQPRDIFNPSTSAATPQMGGIDLNALAAKRAQYTPGAGGVDNNMETQLLQNLGYTRGADGSVGYQPIYDRPDIANNSNAYTPTGKATPQQLAAWEAQYGDSWARQHGGKRYSEIYPPKKTDRLMDILRGRLGYGA